MREKFNHLYLDSHERKLLIHSLVELKNQLIQQGRYTDCIDELIFKVINAPTKRMKIEYVYKPKERVTYKMIKEYIEATYGFKVHTAYIAEVKRDLSCLSALSFPCLLLLRP